MKWSGWFRIAFLSFAFIGLGLYLFATTPWLQHWRTHAAESAAIAQGQPIVDALHRFHASTNLWPEYLDDLVPTYLPHRPDPKWFYTLIAGAPSLARDLDSKDSHLGYEFTPSTGQWIVFGNDSPRPLSSSDTAPTTLPALSPDALITNELAELDRRIAREPTTLAHYRGKASLLRSLNRAAELNATLDQAAAALPDSSWPAAAQAALKNSRNAFLDFYNRPLERSGSTHFYYAFVLARLLNDDDHAGEMIHYAVSAPLTLDANDDNKLAFYYWDMTRWALQHEKWTAALEAANRWEEAYIAKQTPESSYLPLRAAIHLALGDQPAAQADLDTLAKRPLTPTAPLWAENLDPLRQAVTRNDRTFHYNPGPTPPPYEIFALPQ